jgi:integrase/recombinase XerC/integrase/recombinase XerD
LREKSGSSVQEVKEFARHKNLNTTMIYAHNIERIGEEVPERRIEQLLKVA